MVIYNNFLFIISQEKFLFVSFKDHKDSDVILLNPIPWIYYWDLRFSGNNLLSF